MTTLARLAALALLLLSSPALAREPGSAGRGQLGLVLGGGVNLTQNARATNIGGQNAYPGYNPYGFGVGLRGGYTLKKPSLYVGALFMYFVGERDSVSAFGLNVSAGLNYFILGGELGYDIGVGPVVIRPSLALGAGILRAHACGVGTSGTCDGDSDTSIMIGPSAAVLYVFDKLPLYFGAELRFLIVPMELQNSTVNHDSALFVGLQGGLAL